MTQNKSPAFQFYPNDWLSSPQVQIMDAAQEGAYIRLLCYCWSSGDCSLPDDDEKLARLARIDKGGLTVVKGCFNQHPTKAGFITHKRLLLEYEKQKKWREKSSAGGRKSVENKRRFKGGSKMVATKGQPSGNSSSSSSNISANADNNTHTNAGAGAIKNDPPQSRMDQMLAVTFDSFTGEWLEKYGFSREVVEHELEGMRDYFATQPKRLLKYTDYVAFARTWIKNNVTKGSQHGNGANSFNRGQATAGGAQTRGGRGQPSGTDKALSALFGQVPSDKDA